MDSRYGIYEFSVTQKEESASKTTATKCELQNVNETGDIMQISLR